MLLWLSFLSQYSTSPQPRDLPLLLNSAQEADAKYRAAKAAQPAPDDSHRLGHGAEKDKVRAFVRSRRDT